MGNVKSSNLIIKIVVLTLLPLKVCNSPHAEDEYGEEKCEHAADASPEVEEGLRVVDDDVDAALRERHRKREEHLVRHALGRPLTVDHPRRISRDRSKPKEVRVTLQEEVRARKQAD